MASNRLSSLVWKVSLPIIFVEAVETFDHLIDTLFLSRVGITELGAIAVADSVLYLFLVVPLALVDGIQIVRARRAGQRRPEEVGAIFNPGLLLVLLVCLGSTVALKMASPLVTRGLVESEAVGVAADDYLQIDAYTLSLTGATFACSALLTSLGRTWALVPATLILVVADVILNYLFIFGKFGCPALGIRGAAVGSLGAAFAALVFLILYVGWCLDARYGCFRFRGLGKQTMLLLSRLSAPIAVQGGLETLRWFVFFLIMERVSPQALAMASIVYTCYTVFRIPTQGFAETTCSMVSRFAGRNWGHRMGALLQHAIGGAMLATGPFILAALLAPHWVVAVFAPEAAILAQSQASVRLVALAMLVAIPGEMWFVAVLGTGDTAASLGIEFVLTLTMLGLTYYAAIALAWPVTFVWLSLPLAWLLVLTLSYSWMKSGIWKRLQV